MSTQMNKKNEKTFEDALQRLEEIAQLLENEETPLEDSIQLFEEGIELKDFCEEKLKSAKLKINKIIWDVGHQTYPHKILTGRKSKIHTLRKKNGLSGFTKRSESIYDPFGAAHSSTSVSANLGITAARDMLNQNFDIKILIEHISGSRNP